MSCCAKTAFCSLFEVYQGKQEKNPSLTSIDTRTGPSALIRCMGNLEPTSDFKKRVVVTDSYFTSLSAVIRLMETGYYCIGTIQTRTLGYPAGVKVLKSEDRGTLRMAKLVSCPTLVAIGWRDSKDVHFFVQLHLEI